MAITTEPAVASGAPGAGEPAPAVEFVDVGKRFRLRDGRTLAEFVPSLLKGRAFTPPFWALRHVSFEVRPGGTLGIIGRNGSGKSTLLKLIAGVTAPTEGRVAVRGRVAPLLELGASFHPDLTGLENLYLEGSILGLKNSEIRERISEIVDFAEMAPFLDTPVKRYSSGMYVRLAFSVIVHSDPDVLLVDEALAVGDGAFQEKCLAKMAELRRAGVTVLLVSHSMDRISAFCDRVLVLERGSLFFEGEPRAAIAEYERLLAAQGDAAPGPGTGGRP
ncbi:MAG TPA: ABC transporter ATP-binding protein [Dehalococcoidia bacterium]|nr:ABC transporter ATP-binding protein [Dehalococcoidia bacterium]